MAEKKLTTAKKGTYTTNTVVKQMAKAFDYEFTLPPLAGLQGFRYEEI